LSTSKVTVRMDETVKKQFELVLDGLGMNLSTGINVFARAVIRHGGFPFELNDPFYNEANMQRLAHSEQQAERGELIYKTAEELGLDDE